MRIYRHISIVTSCVHMYSTAEGLDLKLNQGFGLSVVIWLSVTLAIWEEV